METLLLNITIPLISAIGIAGFLTSDKDIPVFLKEKILYGIPIYLANNAKYMWTARLYHYLYSTIKTITSCEYCISFWTSIIVLLILGNSWFSIPFALFNALVLNHLFKNVFDKTK